MKTILRQLFLHWPNLTTLIGLPVCIGVLLLLFFFIRKENSRQSSLAEKTSPTGEDTILNADVSVETTPSKNGEPATEKPLVPTAEKTDDHVREISNADEIVNNYLFQCFMVDWMNNSGLELNQPISKGDVFLVFQRDIPDTNLVQSVILVCLWKSSLIKGRVQWARSYQMSDYRQFEDSTNVPVFVAVGMGGEPNRPQSVHLVPLKKVRSNVLSENQMGPDVLSMDDHYFDTVRNCLTIV